MEMKMEIQVEAFRTALLAQLLYSSNQFILSPGVLDRGIIWECAGNTGKSVNVGKAKTRREFNMIRTRTAYGNFAEIPGHTHDEDREQVRWARQLDCVQLNPLSGAHFAIALGGRVG
jgi:hypothetical protein